MPAVDEEEVKIVNPLEYPSWDNLLLPHDNSSFFHSSRWARLLAETYDYRPIYFALFDGSGLSALVPVMEVKSFLTGKRGVSLPFTDYCEPLAAGEQQFRRLFGALAEYGRLAGWKHIEFRGGSDFFCGVPPSSSSYGHALDLSKGEDSIFSGLRDSTKRNIKKARREGVQVLMETSAYAVDEFYGLNCLTRKIHGLPPQPYGFFRGLFTNIIDKGSGFVALASYKGKIVAGAVFLHSGGKAIYKYGASDRAYGFLRANNLVMWEAISWYAKNGYSQLCLGRTEPGNSGLRQFKAGWGASERTINYYRYDLGKKAFVRTPLSVSGTHNAIFRRMPAPLLRAAGAIMYRHMG